MGGGRGREGEWKRGYGSHCVGMGDHCGWLKTHTLSVSSLMYAVCVTFPFLPASIFVYFSLQEYVE